MFTTAHAAVYAFYIMAMNHTAMTTTRVFKSGNSQAVRIPGELQYERTDIEYEIERVGDEVRIRPSRRRLNHLADKFAAFSPDFAADGRDAEADQDREPL